MDSIAQKSFRELLRDLGRHTGIYGIGTLLAQFTSFLFLPIYLVYLTPEDFGIVTAAGIVTLFLGSLLCFNFQEVIVRFYYEWKREGTVAQHLGAIWSASAVSGLGATLLLVLGGEWVLRLLITQVPFRPYIQLAVWSAFFTSFWKLAYFWFRVTERSTAATLCSLANLGISIAAKVVFVIYLRQGALGALKSDVVAGAVMLAVYTLAIRPHARFLAGWGVLRPGVAYAIPLLPALLVTQASGVLDRFLLEKFVPLHDLGLYGAAQKIAQILMAVTGTIKTAWIPFYFRVAIEHPDHKQVLGRAGSYVISGLIIAGTFIAILSQSALQIIGKGQYVAAANLVPILILGYLCSGIAMTVQSGIFMEKRTGEASALGALSSVVLLGTSLVLLPRFGARGAAWASTITLAVQGASFYVRSQQVFPVAYRWRHLGVLSGAGIAMVCLTAFVHLGTQPWASALVRGGVAALALGGTLAVLERRSLERLWAMVAYSKRCNETSATPSTPRDRKAPSHDTPDLFMLRPAPKADGSISALAQDGGRGAQERPGSPGA